MFRKDCSTRASFVIPAVLVASLVAGLGQPRLASAAFTKPIVKDMHEVFATDPRGSFTPAVSETTIRHQVFGDSLEGSTAGWGIINFRQGQPNAWHILSGTHSCVGNAWWCGQGGFTNGEGYDNNWVQILKPTAVSLTGYSGVKLTFKHRMQSETGYDWGWVMIHDAATTSAWDTLASYSGDFGSSCLNASLDIPNAWTTRPQPIQLMFLFASDLNISTADSAGGFTGWSIDDVKITRQGSQTPVFFDDMESGSGQWTAYSANPGAWWHIESQPLTTPAASCSFLYTNVWVPFQGSVFGTVPDLIDAMLTTPPIDLQGVFRTGNSDLRLVLDDWMDLPPENAMYWSLWIQGSNDGITWTPWRNALGDLVLSGGVPQCTEGEFYVFDPYYTTRTGIQPGTRYIKLGFRIRDEKQVTPPEDGAIVRMGFQTEGVYFDNIGLYYVYTITGVETVSGATAGARASVDKVFPNPFNPSTTVQFSVPKSGPASVRVYDIHGRLAATLVDKTMPAGVYRVRWNGQTDDGRELPTGVYFARLASSGGRASARLMMIK